MLKTAKELNIETLTKPKPGELHHAHCSGVVAFPDGEVLVVFYWALQEANRKQAIFSKRKSIGKEWSESIKIQDDKHRMIGNPAIWIAPEEDKKLFLFYVRSWGGWAVCNPRFKTSTDKGNTWSRSKSLYWFVSRGIKNPPIKTLKGWYILPAYVEFRDYFSVFYISKDKGKTWRDTGARVKIPDDKVPKELIPDSRWGRLVLQPTVIERKDGSLIALMRAKRPLGIMYKTESFDGGITWTDATPYILPNPGGGFHWMRLNSGKLAIIYNHAPVLPDHLYERNPLSIALSEDDGKTWSYRRNIMEAHGDMVHQRIGGYPTLTQGENDKIHATWSFAHKIEYEGKEINVTDIQYTSFTEDWIKEKAFFDEPWENNL